MNEKIQQKVIKTLKFCISNDGRRLNIAGIHHDESFKKALSTNGYTMTASKSLYCDDIKGLTIDPETCGVIKREFVKMGVILNYNVEKMKVNKIFIPKTLPTGKKLKAWFYLENGEMKIGLDERKDYEFVIQCQYLKTLADDSTYTVHYGSALSPVYFDLTGDESFDELFVAMPVKV